MVLVDITSTRMLGAYGFLARVFNCFDKNKLSIDVIASSEVSVSLTLNKRLEVKRKERDAGGLVQDPAKQARDPSGSTVLDAVVEELSEVASVELTSGHAIITLIANVGKSSQVLSSVFGVMAALGIPVTMLSQARATATTPFRPRAPRRAPRPTPHASPECSSQGASKVNISMVVPEERATEAIKELHKCFFEGECSVPVAVALDGSAA